MAETQENESVLEELKNLKKSIVPMVSFMNEFRDLKLKNKISVDSHVNIFNLLSSNIREDVLKDVMSLNSTIKESIEETKEMIVNNQKEMYNKFDYFQNNLLEFDALTGQINESVTQVRGHLTKFYDKFDQIKKDVDEKSSVDDLNEIKLRIKHYAFQSDLDSLKLDIFDKAPKDSIERINRALVRLEGNINRFVDKTDLDSIKRELKLEVEAYVDLNYLLREDFASFKEINSLIKQKADDDFKGLIHRFDNQNRMIKDALEKNTAKLKNKP